MGEMKVPESAYYGAETARAVLNFPISNLRFSKRFISVLGLIKKHSARTNLSLGLLSRNTSLAIQKASDEVFQNKLDSYFVVDIFQTGSGTSTNMNANEVIGNRAGEILGGKRGEKKVHPNDHVNLGQSSNDVVPTAIHIAGLYEITHSLLPALTELHGALLKKSKEFKNVWKIGRTHLQDAVPMTLGQEFGGYASQIENATSRLLETKNVLEELALGGTALGTGVNTHKEFAKRTIVGIAKELKLNLRETKNHFSAQSNIDAVIEVSGALRGVAIATVKIASDIRLLGSGPRAGLGEIILPATQPGSSIMPGKVNPVMCEMVIQVGAQVIGNDTTIAFSATQGNFELNTMFPVVAYNFLQSIDLLTNASHVFAKRCISGIKANKKVCEANIEKSLALATFLVPALGYDVSAKIAKVAHESGRTIREVALEISGLNKKQIDTLLKFRN